MLHLNEYKIANPTLL
nr:hypothetical protein [Nostoc favosum]